MEKPKVLWFVNVPFSHEALLEHRHAATGGWLIALANAICRDVQLSVAAIHPYNPRVIRGSDFNSYSIRPQSWRIQLLARSLFNRSLEDGPVLSQMLEIVEDVDPDLVHVHGTEKGYLEILPHAMESGLPVLVSLQGILSAVSRFYLGSYDAQFLRRFWYDRGGSKQSILPKRLLPDRESLERRAARERTHLPLAKYIDGRTQWDNRLAALLSPECEYFHVDRVLRAPFYESRWESGIKNEIFRVHTTLGESLAKGIDVIVEAAFALEEYGLQFEWTLAGVDEGAKNARAARKRFGKSFPPNSLKFLGRMNADELIAHMKRSDVYVMTSFIENSPNNLAEAMIMGMPCVATLAGGTGTYLKDGETGILVQPGDPLGIAAAILEIREQPDRAEELGRRARAAAISRHDPVHVKQQVLHAYTSILDDITGLRTEPQGATRN